MKNRRSTDKKVASPKRAAQSPNLPPASNSLSQDDIGNASINALQYSAHLKQLNYQEAKRELEEFKAEYRKRHLAEPCYSAIPEAMMVNVRNTLLEYDKAEMLVRAKLASKERPGYKPPDSKSPKVLKVDEEFIKESYNPNPTVVTNRFSLASATYRPFITPPKERTNQTALLVAMKRVKKLETALAAYKHIYLKDKKGSVPKSLHYALCDARNEVTRLKHEAKREKKAKLEGRLTFPAVQQLQYRIDRLKEKRRFIRRLDTTHDIKKEEVRHSRLHAVSKEIFYLENQLRRNQQLHDAENKKLDNNYNVWPLVALGALGIITLTYLTRAIFGV